MPESNRPRRICNPLHSHFANPPCSGALPPGVQAQSTVYLKLKSLDSFRNRGLEVGAENEIRTRDPDLGKVVLYQLSYFRINFQTALKQAFAHLRGPADKLKHL